MPNGSKPLSNFLVHISSVLPGASALAPGAGWGEKGHCTRKKDGLVLMESLVLNARNEDILARSTILTILTIR